MLFLIDNLACISQRCAHVGFADSIFMGNFRDAHTTRHSTDNPHDRHSGAANDGFAMLNSRVNDNSIVHFAIPS